MEHVVQFSIQHSNFTQPLPIQGSASWVDVAPQDRQRTEHWLTETPGVDADRSLETVGQRLPRDRAPDAVGKARKIREAYAEIDRHCRVSAGGQREPQREVDVGGARVLEKQRAFQRSQ